MKKKFVALLMVAAVMMEGAVLMAQEPQIQEETQMEAVQVEETKGSFVTQKGEVTELTKEDNGWKMLVGNPIDGTLFSLHGQEVIINAATLDMLEPEDLRVGMEVTVVIPKNAPIGLSLPAYCAAQVAVIVNAEDRSVEVSYFNEELVNETNTLALNVEKNTRIFNTIGERRRFTEEDIKEHNAVVFYTGTTRSIPAQTTPDMVVILPVEEEANDMEAEVANQGLENAVALECVAVRKLATEYGYEVKWDHMSKTATLTKEDKCIYLTIGEETIKCDDREEKLDSKVKLVDGKAYVSTELSKYL